MRSAEQLPVVAALKSSACSSSLGTDRGCRHAPSLSHSMPSRCFGSEATRRCQLSHRPVLGARSMLGQGVLLCALLARTCTRMHFGPAGSPSSSYVFWTAEVLNYMIDLQCLQCAKETLFKGSHRGTHGPNSSLICMPDDCRPDICCTGGCTLTRTVAVARAEVIDRTRSMMPKTPTLSPMASLPQRSSPASSTATVSGRAGTEWPLLALLLLSHTCCTCTGPAYYGNSMH